MALAPGSRLGPYEIVALLGEGGMGEVYRARDARLGRDVAIKVLPDALAGDAERLARFDREARLLASMNYPGIAALYGVEQAGGRPALVMEVVEGPTLAERLERGALAEDEVLAIARPLADALEYAHDRGIVHRDLKPANLKLRPDGAVKVLDFGLARALDTGGAASGSDLTQSPTVTQRMTSAGVVLGTAAYMAPEQARGREVDRRADVWAFGVLLYEMLSGRRAFSGETVSDTLAAVMRDEPDWSALPAGLAPGWRPLLARCLTKDPRARLQAIGEARIALADLSAGPAAPASAGKLPVAGARGAFAALVLMSLALAAVAGWSLLRRPPGAPEATEVSVMLPAGQRLAEDVGYHFFALAPDGHAIVYAALGNDHWMLHLRRLDRREDIELPGTEDARNPFFSPDGEWVGYFNSLKMSKVSVHGGAPVELAEAGQDRLGTWLSDGTIVYSFETTTPLMRLPAGGGTPVAVTTIDTTRHERSHRFPSALAGGPWVVFTVGRTDSPGGYDDAPIDAVNVKTGERRRLVKAARRALWAPPGWIVYDRLGDLYASRIDPKDPRPVTESAPVLSNVAGQTSSGAAFFDVANDGTLAWVPDEARARQREIGWLDRTGRWTPAGIPAGEHLLMRLSPDGRRALVLSGAGGGNADVWLADLATGGLTRLTYGNRVGSVAWLRDGTRFVYSRTEERSGESVIERRLDGAGGERVLDIARWPLFLTDTTPDGRRIVYAEYGNAQGRIRTAAVDGDPDVRRLAGDLGNDKAEQAGMVSPDGRWLAYISNRTRREEVYVRALDGSGGRWQVSSGGGGGIRWGRAGRELFFVHRERLMRVTVSVLGSDLVLGQPEPLVAMPGSAFEATFRDYDYDAVHDRFLVARSPFGVLERREIALSLGWSRRLSALRRSVPGAP